MSNNSSEINIIFFIDQIIKRWKFFLFLQIILIITFFLYIKNTVYESVHSLEFVPLTEIQLAQYGFINNKLNFKLNKEIFTKVFFDGVNEKSAIKENLIKYNFINRNNFDNDSLFEQALSQLSKNVKFESYKRDESNKESETYYKLSFFTKEGDNINDFFQSTIASLDRNVRNNMVTRFDQFISNYKKETNFLISKLENKFINLKEKYNHLTLTEIEDLREHAATARKLGIKNVTEFSDGEKPFEPSGGYAYLRGYLILETQIESLKLRVSNPLIYSNELYSANELFINTKEEMIRYIELLKSEILNTNIYDENFQTFNYDISSIESIKIEKNPTVPILIFLIPNLIFFIFIFTLYLRHQLGIYREKSSQ
tara:strand:- start:111 stop:1220 length:1110 start_codon:yes stop_codon:yes gene_type:complete